MPCHGDISGTPGLDSAAALDLEIQLRDLLKNTKAACPHFHVGYTDNFVFSSFG